ncbi:MAG: hypothetical protein FJW86_10830 [Actinobacteria bacterium]|nr:hypothetical protein [Actinomycetota bacterium]
MAQNVEIRIPKWLVYALAAVLLIGAGVGAGLVVGGDDSTDSTVATARRPKASTTSTSTSTTSTTSAPAVSGGGGSGGANAGGGSGNAGNEGNAGGQVAPPAPPAPPAATANVSKSGACPTLVTWSGTGGTNGYTLQVYHAINPGLVLFNGSVNAAGDKTFDCVQAGELLISKVGLVRFNSNTATGTESDTA